MTILKKFFYKFLTRNIPTTSISHDQLLDTGYFSQFGQDKFVAEYFNFKKNGVFFDIGASDGIHLSNTYYLEKELGWNGVVVDPIANNYQMLLTNRSCIKVNGCISNTRGNTAFLEIDGYSKVLSGIIDKYDPKHLKRIQKEIAKHGGTYKTINVDCFTVEDIATANNINEIDYLSIDTEGGELDILKSINFNALLFKVISVENNYNDLRTKSFLTKFGYKLAAITGDDEIYVKM